MKEKLNFDDAKEKCHSMGAKLFEPRNNHENEFIKNLTKTHDITEYWIGIEKGLDGFSVYSSDNSTVSWSHLEPMRKIENHKYSMKCSMVCFNCELSMWKDEYCSLKKHSVCDKHIGKSSFHTYFPKLPYHYIQKLTPICFLSYVCFDFFWVFP